MNSGLPLSGDEPALRRVLIFMGYIFNFAAKYRSRFPSIYL